MEEMKRLRRSHMMCWLEKEVYIDKGVERGKREAKLYKEGIDIEGEREGRERD